MLPENCIFAYGVANGIQYIYKDISKKIHRKTEEAKYLRHKRAVPYELGFLLRTHDLDSIIEALESILDYIDSECIRERPALLYLPQETLSIMIQQSSYLPAEREPKLSLIKTFPESTEDETLDA